MPQIIAITRQIHPTGSGSSVLPYTPVESCGMWTTDYRSTWPHFEVKQNVGWSFATILGIQNAQSVPTFNVRPCMPLCNSTLSWKHPKRSIYSDCLIPTFPLMPCRRFGVWSIPPNINLASIYCSLCLNLSLQILMIPSRNVIRPWWLALPWDLGLLTVCF